jgi:hypothetical protein
MKQADPRDMFTKVSKSVCTLTVVVFPDPLSPAPLISTAMKTPENKRTLMTLNQQVKEITKLNIPVISCTTHI